MVQGITLKIRMLCFVLINSVLLNLLCVWIWVTENSKLPSSLFSLWLLCLLSWFEKNISAWDISVFYFCCCCFMLLVVVVVVLCFVHLFVYLFVKIYLIPIWFSSRFFDDCLSRCIWCHFEQDFLIHAVLRAKVTYTVDCRLWKDFLSLCGSEIYLSTTGDFVPCSAQWPQKRSSRVWLQTSVTLLSFTDTWSSLLSVPVPKVSARDCLKYASFTP